MQRIFSKSIFLTECILTLEQLLPQRVSHVPALSMPPLTRRRLYWLLLAVLTVAALVCIAIGAKNALLENGSHDFQWFPARDLLAGINPYQYFIEWKNGGYDLTPPHFLNQSPSYPASVYVMLAPLGMLEWEIAKIVWLVINLSLIALLLLGMQKQFPIDQPMLLVIVPLLFLCSTPLRASLGAGQMNLLSLTAFIWSYYYAQRHNHLSQTLAGILLAIAWTKYSLTFPLTLIFINERNWRPIVVAAGVHAVLTLIASWQLSLLPHEFFFSSVAVVMMGNVTGFANISAIAMMLHVPAIAAMSLIIFALAVIACKTYRLTQVQPLVLMSFLALISYTLFYHHNYDFIVLLLLAWCIATEKMSVPTTVATLTLITLSWFGLWLADELQAFFLLESTYLTSMAVSLQVLAFYVSLALFANSLWRCRGEKFTRQTTIAF